MINQLAEWSVGATEIGHRPSNLTATHRALFDCMQSDSASIDERMLASVKLAPGRSPTPKQPAVFELQRARKVGKLALPRFDHASELTRALE